MKTYRFYLKAAQHFLNLKDYSKFDGNEKEYCHFSVFIFSWIALESYVNMVSESLSYGTRLKNHEKAFLLEQELKVNADGIFKTSTIRPKTTKKILFLLHHFSKIKIQKFKQHELWKNLTAFEELRNRIIHFKEKNEVKISFKKATECKENTEKTIKYLNMAIFGKR